MDRTENPAALAGAHRAEGMPIRDVSAFFFTPKHFKNQPDPTPELPVTGFRSVGQILHGMGFAFDKAGEVI